MAVMCSKHTAQLKTVVFMSNTMFTSLALCVHIFNPNMRFMDLFEHLLSTFCRYNYLSAFKKNNVNVCNFMSVIPEVSEMRGAVSTFVRPTVKNCPFELLHLYVIFYGFSDHVHFLVIYGDTGHNSMNLYVQNLRVSIRQELATKSIGQRDVFFSYVCDDKIIFGQLK